MSAIERQHRQSLTPEVVIRPRAAARRLRFRWSISPAAAAGAGLCPEGTREASLELAVEIAKSKASARALPVVAALVFDGRPAPIDAPHAEGAAVTDAETGVLHIDIDGFIHATLRDGGDVLYARTPLLARLGLRGGRYEREGLCSRE